MQQFSSFHSKVNQKPPGRALVNNNLSQLQEKIKTKIFVMKIYNYCDCPAPLTWLVLGLLTLWCRSLKASDSWLCLGGKGLM